MTHDNQILEQAAIWAVRTGEPDFVDWDGFIEWLEADPAHAEAYDRVKAGVEDAAEAIGNAAAPVNDNETVGPLGNRRWFALAASMAAAITAVFGAWLLNDPTYSIETQPGASRLVQLETGGEVNLAGGSKMTFDRDDPSGGVLDRGQALFTLAHNADHPFRVEVGDNTLVDIGTIFDVKYSGTKIAVAVSDGAVLLNPDEESIEVEKGQLLTLDESRASYELGAVALSQVGEWREGRLTFRDELLADLAADLSRSTGIDFEVAPGASDMRVSGSLLFAPVRDDPASLGALLGVSVRKSGEKWVIAAN